MDKDALTNVGLPVLLPQDSLLLSNAFLTQGDGWYAVSMHGGGRHVTMQGVARVVVHPIKKGPRAMAAKGPRVGASNKIYSVAFERYGVAYILDLECDHPGVDPRCAGPEHARALYDSLLVIGGAP